MVLYIRPSAERDLREFPVPVQERILNKLKFYASATEPMWFAKPLRNPGLGRHRFRIGDYRAIFDVAGDTIFVLAIKHRKDAY